MFDRFMEFVYGRTFAGLLALVNGWVTIQNLNAGAWGWACVSGFFCWLMGRQYLALR